METPKSAAPSRTPPVRDEFWSEAATWTLVNAWGNRFMELNRGNLRQHDWRAVVDAVNDAHGDDVRSRRTDVQCKNRLDTMKKKYKAEKTRVSESNEESTWPFYERMDELMGCVLTSRKMETPPETARMTDTPPAARSILPMGIPLPRCRFEPVTLVPPQKRPAPVENDPPFSLTCGPMGIPLLPNQKPMGAQAQKIIPQKRAAPLVTAPVVDNSHLRGNYSAVTAAAADVVEDNDVEDSGSAEEVGEGCDGDGISRLAKAIDTLGEMYERVQGEKQKQLIELEKQRILFAKDMEVERMKLFMDTQVQLVKIKQAKRSGLNGEIPAFAASQPFGNL